MFDVCLLGTGGMLPLPKRFLTSCIMRYKGTGVLIDCGEGTQVTLSLLGWSMKNIDYILFTHYHGDHISGLPGLLLSIGNCDRTEPVTLIGPKGLRRIVEGLLLIAPELPFELRYVELSSEDLGKEQKLGELWMTPFAAHHGVTCYGYSIQVKRQPRFDAERAKAAEIPLPYWHRLQNGETITDGDVTYTPDMVLGEARKGIKLVYCTDSRPKAGIIEAARGADLFICEGLYGDPEKQDKAKEHMHMSYQEAAQMAREAGVRELWLTHFSPAMPNPMEFIEEARAIFPNCKAGKDRKLKEFVFEED